MTVSKNGCIEADTITVSVVNCCPVITTTDTRDTLCSGYYGEFFIANYTDLGANGIKFVLFTSPQTASSMYTGGTEVTPSSFSNGVAQWPIGQPGSQFPANNGTTPVNYYVYAILSTTPTDPNCRPYAEKIFTILPLPTFTATPQPACTYDQTYVLNVNIAATGTFTVTFARNLTTVGNGPIPVDQFFTQSNVPGNTTTPFNVPIAEANGFFVFVQNQATGCAVVGPSGSPTITAKPNAGQDKSLDCADPVQGTLQSTTTLTGFSPSGGSWSPQAGNPASSTVDNSGSVTGMTVAGTYRFIYSVNGCTDTVAVTVQPCAGCVKPDAGEDVVICEPQSAYNLFGFAPSGGTWAAQPGNPASASINSVGQITGMTANGTYRFIYTVQFGGEFCSDTVAVIRQPKPNAGQDQTICEPAATAVLTGFSPAGGTWTAALSNPAMATVNNAGQVAGLIANGTYRFIYTVNGCADTVQVFRNAKPNAGSNQSICAPQTTASLTGFSPAGGTWTAAVGNPSVATVTNAGVVSGMTGIGTYNFIYTVNGCADTVAVLRIAKPNAGQNQSICEPQTTANLSGFSPAGGTWTAQTGNPAGATVTNAGAVSGMTVNGTYNFIYTVNGCTDTVAVIRNAKPYAGPDQTICNPQTSVSLTGFPLAGGSWTVASGNPAGATITNAGVVSGLTVNGTYKFVYSVNGCTDTVAVLRTAKPIAGPDQNICEPQTIALLSGFSPAGGTWIVATGNPAGATVTNDGLVTGMTVNGTYKFVYLVNDCSDTVSIFRNPQPNAGPDQTVCAPQTATTLLSFSPSGGTWTALPGNPATATVTNAGVVTGMTVDGVYNFIYTVNGCSDIVVVIRSPKPNAGQDQSLACADPVQGTLQTSTSLTGFSPSGGNWSAQAGNPAAATVTNAGAVTGMTVAGTYRFIYTLNGCADTVAVTVQPCQGCVKPDAGQDVAICEPQTSVTLSGFSPAGGTWSAQAGNPAGATVTNAGLVSGMTANGTYRFIYTVQQGGQFCTDTVQVVRQAKPNAGSDQTICEPQTTTTLTGFSPVGGAWTTQAGNPAGATVTNAGVVSGMTVNGIYRFIYTLNGCADTVQVTRNPKPNAGVDVSVCQPVTSVALSGFSPAGGTWTAATGNPSGASITNQGQVSGLAAVGNYKFVYTVNGCSDTVNVTLTIKPTAGSDQILSCADPVQGTLQTSTTLTGFSPAGGIWTVASGNPAAAIVSNAGAVSGMTVAGTYRFVYSLNGCADTVAVTVQPCQGCVKPNAGEDVAICEPTASLTLSGFSPAGGIWTAQVGNPIGATISNAGLIAGMVVNGTYRFIYTVQLGGQFCSDTVQVIRRPKPNAGPDQTVCEPLASTILTGFSPIGGTWMAQPGNPANATVTNQGVVTGLTASGSYRFIYTVNGCADTVEVVRTAKPNAGTDQSICEPQTALTLTGFTPAGGTWTTAAGNPAAATISNSGVISGMVANGMYKFVYSVSAGGQQCSDTVLVTRKPKPNTGPDQSICEPLTSLTLGGYSPAGGTWTAQSGNPTNASITNAGAITGMTVNGIYRFVYAVNGCSDTVAIERKQKPNAGQDKSLACADPVLGTLQTTTTLTGFSPAGGTWTTQAGNPAAATVTNAGLVSGMTAAGTYRFIYTLNGCADTVAVTVQACVGCTKPDAGPDVAICEPQTDVNLTGFSPAGGTWSVAAGNPAGATVSNAGLVSGMIVNGTYRFIYTVQQGGQFCSDTVAVVRNLKPNAGQDVTLCAPLTSVALTGFVPAGGTWTAQAGNPAAATVNNQGVVSGLTVNGIYRFIYTLNGCADTVQVTRNPKPNAGPDQSICEPQTTTSLTGFSPAGGSWTAQAGNPASATVNNSGVVSGMTVNGTYRFIYTVNGCADTVQVVRNLKPNAGADKSLACADPVLGTLQTTTTLTGFSPAGGTWSVQAGNPANAAVNNSGTVSGMTVAGTYRFIYTLNGCADTVAVTVQTCVGCTKPDAGQDVALCEPQTAVTLTGFSPAGGTWSVAAGNPAGATVSNAGLVSGMVANGTYRFIYTVQQGGQFCSDTVQVMRKLKPVVGNAVLCEPATTATLTLNPSGGTWGAIGSNPSNASVSPNGQVTGLTVNGTYQFVYTLNGCADTAVVIRYSKPNAGPDIVANQAICNTVATVDLPNANEGESWSQFGNSPKAVTINTSTGVVTGMDVVGTYQFILTNSVTNCSDTVAVEVKECRNGSIGDFVWNDLNDNGQQDADEPGVNGVKVILWSAVGGVPSAKLDSTVTAGNGAYSFTNLPAGNYIVQIVTNSLPSGFVISTKQNVGNDATDSDFSQAGLSPMVNLDPVQGGLLQNNPTIDAGLYSPKGSIGDFVWKDLNDNGQQDAGEPGVNGVKVILWSAVGGLPSAKLDSTVTAGNGAYNFTNLSAGSYIVQILVSTLPDSCQISTKQNVGNDATDSDFSQAGLSPVVSIDPTLGGLSKDNNTIDAGLYVPCVKPVIGSAVPTAATCTGTAVNNDAKFTVSGISGGNRYTYATSLAGLASYTNATVLAGSSFTVLNLPNPSPAGQTYYVRIYYGKNDCFTDITVLIPYQNCSNNCVKPIAGPDVTICKPSTSYDLPDALVYQEWTTGPGNPVPATVTPSTGVVSGMTVSGVYTFILRDKSLSSTCADTVSIFLGVQDIPLQSTCFDTLSLPFVSGATYAVAPGNTASVTPSGFASGMTAIGTIYKFLIRKNNCVDTIRVERLDCSKKYDLALDKSISKKTALLGDTLTYTVRVWNEGEATAHGIEVTDPLNAGVQYISSSAETGMYNFVNKKWSFDSLVVGDTVTLSIKVRVIAQGVWFNTAEITKMSEEDLDSTPNNGVEGEDDMDRECFTVPILICRGQGSGIQLSVPGEYTGVVWFRKTQGGEPVQVGTGNSFLATETELGNYEYSFTSTSGNCPAEGCCPIIIVVEDCCPAEVCVPFVITKKRK